VSVALEGLVSHVCDHTWSVIVDGIVSALSPSHLVYGVANGSVLGPV